MKLRHISKNRLLLAFNFVAYVGAALSLASCGGGGGGGGSSSAPPTVSTPPSTTTPDPGPDCSVDAQKAFVVDLAQDWYLWYDELANVDQANYDSPDALLAAITAPLAPDGRDPGFSYVTTIAADEANYTSGAYVGFGFRYGFTADNRFVLSDVFEGSPAADAGLARSVEVLAIDTGNGFETIDELGVRQATVIEVFGESEVGVERGFRIKSGDNVSEVVIAKTELVTPPLVEAPKLIEREGLSPVGYFQLRGFTLSAMEPLEAMTAELAAAGVTDLIVDLRYNGGGLLEVADRVLDVLGGIVAEDATSFRMRHNDKHSNEDVEAVFAARETSMAPLRVAFIVTSGTASASELIINSLEPHIETVLVGSNTVGKAVGQYAFDMPDCETRVRLISFEIVNGEDVGGFYSGLFETGRFNTCAADDDITKPWGDTTESSLATALGWLNGNGCSVAASSVNNFRGFDRGQSSPLMNQKSVPDRRSGFVQ